MTRSAEPASLRQGRERYQAREASRRRQEAIRLVREYRAWLRAGLDPKRAPARIPSDNEFKLARSAR